ncbi:MAG: TolC family protein [Gammaproteobacteria bacterium]|nr:TolC family protein [Gammaproteobacteria bacterium]
MVYLSTLCASGRYRRPIPLSYVFVFLIEFVRRVGLLLIGTVFYAASATAEPLTLEQAWQLAEQANPTLLSTQARLDAAQGEFKDARAPLWNNPEIFGEVRERDSSGAGGAGANNLEGGLGVSQTFETGGQQRARRAAAQQNLAATEQDIQETRRQIRAKVEARFVDVLSLQQRIQSEQETLRLIEQASQVVKKRVAAGEDSRLEGNLAKVEAERAQNQVALLSERLTQARAELAALLQLPAENLPEVAGSLEPTPATYTLENLLERAANRPILRALEFRENAARSRLQLERGAVYPDVTLSLKRDRERELDSTADIIGLSVNVPLPLFRRNATGIGRAVTELTQTQIERQTANRGARAQVMALWQQLENLRARLARLQQSVLPSLEENLSLSTKSYEEGEIGLTQLLLVNRQVLDVRRDLLDARTALRLTKTQLETAAGWPG